MKKTCLIELYPRSQRCTTGYRWWICNRREYSITETRNESGSPCSAQLRGLCDDEKKQESIVKPLYLFIILSRSGLPLCILVRKYSSLSCCVMVLFRGNFDMSHLSFRKSITAATLSFIIQEVSSTFSLILQELRHERFPLLWASPKSLTVLQMISGFTSIQ